MSNFHIPSLRRLDKVPRYDDTIAALATSKLPVLPPLIFVFAFDLMCTTLDPSITFHAPKSPNAAQYGKQMETSESVEACEDVVHATPLTMLRKQTLRWLRLR